MANSSPRETLAERVTIARDLTGISVVELSNRTNIARTTLQRKLAGAVDFNISELDAIAKVLSLDLATLIAEYAEAA